MYYIKLPVMGLLLAMSIASCDNSSFSGKNGNAANPTSQAKNKGDVKKVNPSIEGPKQESSIIGQWSRDYPYPDNNLECNYSSKIEITKSKIFYTSGYFLREPYPDGQCPKEPNCFETLEIEYKVSNERMVTPDLKAYILEIGKTSIIDEGAVNGCTNKYKDIKFAEYYDALVNDPVFVINQQKHRYLWIYPNNYTDDQIISYSTEKIGHLLVDEGT
jgi:hypothetical protein